MRRHISWTLLKVVTVFFSLLNMATQMLPPALVSVPLSGTHEDESSTGSMQRLITDAMRTASANDYRRHLRSANKRVDTSASAAADAITKASERLTASVVGPAQTIARCAEQLKDIDVRMKTHASAVAEHQNHIEDKMHKICTTVTEVALKSANVKTELREAIAEFRARLRFAVELNTTVIAISMLGLAITLFYVFCEFVSPDTTPEKRGRRAILLWLGSVMLSVGLAFHAYLFCSAP